MASEASPHAYHRVSRKEKTRVQFLQKLGVKGCDMDIVEVSGTHDIVIIITRSEQAKQAHSYAFQRLRICPLDHHVYI